MEIFKVQKVDSHGGSLRIFVKNQDGKFDMDVSVSSMLEKERKIGIGDYEIYKKFLIIK